MTAPSVMAPGAPSTGPGLKPKDRSLAWTSLISSRRSGAAFGAGSTGDDSLAVTGAAAGTTAGVKATLVAVDGDEGADDGHVRSGGAAAGAAAILSRDDVGSGRAAALEDAGTVGT